MLSVGSDFSGGCYVSTIHHDSEVGFWNFIFSLVGSGEIGYHTKSKYFEVNVPMYNKCHMLEVLM